MDATRGTDVEVVELTREEARRYLDGITRHELGMSGEEFLDQYEGGKLDGNPDDTLGLVNVLMALPFGR